MRTDQEVRWREIASKVKLELFEDEIVAAIRQAVEEERNAVDEIISNRWNAASDDVRYGAAMQAALQGLRLELDARARDWIGSRAAVGP